MYYIYVAQQKVHCDSHMNAKTCFTRKTQLRWIMTLSQTRMKGNTFQIKWLHQQNCVSQVLAHFLSPNAATSHRDIAIVKLLHLIFLSKKIHKFCHISNCEQYLILFIKQDTKIQLILELVQNDGTLRGARGAQLLSM